MRAVRQRQRVFPSSLLPTTLASSIQSPLQTYHYYYHATAALSLRKQHQQTTLSPYAVLGVPLHCSFDQVKQAFIKLALQTHPDQQGGSSTSDFLRIRQAFETILRQEKDNHSSNGPTGWSAEELKTWWEQETGEFLSFAMTDETRQEVIHAFRTMGHTAAAQGQHRDKGGYWEMARQLTEREDAMKRNNGGRQRRASDNDDENDDKPVRQQLEASVVNRRRRRRRR